MDSGINGISTSLQSSPLKGAGAAADKERAAARKAAREFEGLLVGMMLKSMRETVGKDLLAGKGQSEEIYRSMLDQEYAKAIVERGGLGLAKTIEAQLIDRTDRSRSISAKPGESASPSAVGE